ncbi:MAG: radical SAM protein, partial [bacterium]
MSTPKPRIWRGKPVTRFHMMAKPIGPICNLDCSYCYYLSKEGLLSTSNKWRMSDQVLEEYIRQYINGQNYEEIVFTWQGGEPTLLGLDFFKRVIELEKKHCPPHKRVENDLQTNGTLLDDEWCEFLTQNNFLVGLSIDGPGKL